jgi:cytochrome c5
VKLKRKSHNCPAHPTSCTEHAVSNVAGDATDRIVRDAPETAGEISRRQQAAPAMSALGHPLSRWDPTEEPAAPVALKLCRACEVVCVADLERCWNCGALLAGEQATQEPAAPAVAARGTTAAPADGRPPWLLEASLIWQGRDEDFGASVRQPVPEPRPAPGATVTHASGDAASSGGASRGGLLGQPAAYPGPGGERWNAGLISSLAVVLGTVAIVGIDQFSLGVSNGFAPTSGQDGTHANVTVAETPPAVQTPSPTTTLTPPQSETAAAPAPEVVLREIPATSPSRLDAGRIAAEPPIRTAEYVVPESAAPAPRRSGKLVYQESCASCHDSGKTNSPSLHDLDAWTERLARGKHSLYASLTAGKGGARHPAPPRSLPDDEVIAATDYLIERLIDLSVARASRAGFSIAYGPGGALPHGPGVEALRE